MKKLLIAILGLLMLVAASSFATQTRTLVMGENNMIMVDDANMFMFPGRVNNYPNLALGEFGDGDMYNFGITWQFNEENPWVLGTFVSYYEPQYGPYSFWGDELAQFPYYYYYPTMAMAPGSEEQLSDSYARRMHILYGRKLGGNNFGFSAEVVRASWEAQEDSGDVLDYDFNPKQSFNQYTFGLGLTEGTSGKWDVGLSFMTGGWTDEDPDGNKISEPKGFMDLSLSGRYFWVRNPKVTLVPHARFAIGKRGAEWLNDPDVSDDNETEEYSLTEFDLGCGMNYTPAPNILAVVDFGFSYETVKAEYGGGAAIPDAWKGEEKETYFVFPYMKLGFEGEVFNWMDIRAGGYTTLWSNSDKWESDFDVDETWNTPSMDTYFGFGFNWGKLYLDTYTDPELLLKGLDFISGSGYDDGGYNMNWQVSMVYEMF
jgi:hypothetical protein